MARNKNKQQKNKRDKKWKNNSRFKNVKKKPKTRSLREIKHIDQYELHAQREPKHRKVHEENLGETELEEEIPLDPLHQLLSTFDTSKKEFDDNVAVDSNEESSEKEMEEVSSHSPAEMEESELSDDSEFDDGDKNVKTMEKSEDDLVEPTDKIQNQESTDEETDDINQKDEEEDSNLSDPFHNHLGYEVDDSVLESVSAVPPKVQVTTLYWPHLHNLKVEIPISEKKDTEEQRTTIDGTKVYAKRCEPPKLITDMNWNNLCLKPQIQDNILKANKNQLNTVISSDPLTGLQKEIFSVINNYQDLFYSERDVNNGEEVRFVYCLHAVNHILKTRLKIVHHNERLVKKSKEEVPDEFRDQGLVRPKVIILVPFRESCLRIVNMISSILIAEDRGNVINKSRFLEEFGGSELIMPKRNPKPEDYELLFKGNIDDTFRIGLSFTKKSLKLYSDFYSSDVIIASPLGLRIIIGADGDKDRDFDFLASVELLIIDQAEIFLMQNWDHLLLVLDNLHIQPKENHGSDFSRIRSWALNGWTKYYRQTLLFSSVLLPELNSLFNRRCQNYAGKIRVSNPVEDGSICRVVMQLSQIFQKLQVNTLADGLDARFKLFVEKILPQYKDPGMTGVLIYVPSYFDYVRLRNYLKNEDYNFVQICEYSKDSKIARARDMFFHNEARFMLYSERFHFFRRIKLKGIRHIIFYQPPNFPHFYSEMCNLMQEGYQNRFLLNDSIPTVTVLYCKYDIHQLSAIVKTTRAAKMISSDKDVHMFTTGQ